VEYNSKVHLHVDILPQSSVITSHIPPILSYVCKISLETAQTKKCNLTRAYLFVFFVMNYNYHNIIVSI